MHTMNLPPSAASLMEATRSIGYSLEAAVADIIDNSVAAGAGHVVIHYPPKSPSDSYIAIVDDGCGMTARELQQAMMYGSRNPTDVRSENDLGRYGLGLKTASLSQCRVLTVVSKKKGKISGCRWDLDHVQSSDT